MPYDTVPGSTDPTTLDGGVYSPIPNDPAVLIESFVEANVAASAASAAAAAASAAAALVSQGAANTSAIAAAASESAAASSASSASASASTASTAATSAAGSASAAATSATNAAASATAASNSASAAATSATNASNSASAASGSASAAAASAAAALTSENNAAASFLSFDQKYLGAKAANPTVNNQGGALAAGMLYFNTGSNELRMYTGSAWISVPGVLSFNSRTGAVTLTSGDVTSALAYTPANKAGDTFSGAVNVTASSGQLLTVKATTASGATVSKFLNSGDLGLTLLQYGPSYASGSVFDVGASGVSIAADAGSFGIGTTNAQPFLIGTNGTTRIHVDSSGNVGFGVTPAYRVDALGGNGNGYRYTGAASQVFFGEAGSIGAVGTLTNHALSFLVNSSAIARFTTQGNFGVGTTPSASWRAGAAAIQAGVFTTLHTASNGGATLAFGAYESGTNAYSYSTTGDLPTVYQQLTGAHIWSAAVAGSAGNPISFTELARLSSTGFGIGVSPTYILDVKSAANGATTPTARIGGARSFFFQPETGGAAIYGPVLGFGAYANTATGNYIQPASIGMTGGALIAGPYGGGLSFYAYNAGVETGTTQSLASTLRMTLTPTGQLWLNRTSDSGLGVIQVFSGGNQVADFAGSTGAYVNVRAGAATTAGVRIAGNAASAGGNSFDLQQDGSGNVDIVNRSNTRLSLYTNTVEVLRLTAAGLIQDAAGNELGFKGVPDASVTSGAFAATDRGKRVKATAGVTIPNSTMANGDVVHVLNTTGSGITITKSITTAYNKNTGSSLGATFTLAARGSMTVEFTSGTECYVGGNIS